MPAAPSVAAEQEGRSIDLTRIRAGFDTLAARHSLTLVEGAGGVLVPLSETLDMAGLAERLGLPVLLVARGALGTINHTRLSLEALNARGLDLAGVVISHGSVALSAADTLNLDALRRELGPRLMGEIPLLARGDAPPPGAIDLDALLRALGRA